jgi:hypothetical protein
MTIAISNRHENPKIDRLSKDDKLRWLFQFVQTNVNQLTPSQQVALGDDLYHAAAYGFEAVRCRGEPLSAKQVCGLHEEVRRGLQTMTAQVQDLVSHPDVAFIGWELPATASKTLLALVRFTPRDRRPKVLRIHPTPPDPADAILQGIVYLLEAAEDRLRVCPECGNLFVRRRRQECCTERCAQKRRNRRKGTNRRRTAASLGTTSA